MSIRLKIQAIQYNSTFFSWISYYLGDKLIAKRGPTGRIFVAGRNMDIYNPEGRQCLHSLEGVYCYKHIVYLKIIMNGVIGTNFYGERYVLLTGDELKMSIQKAYLVKLIS